MKHFIVQEFVPKELYSLYGDCSMRYINPKIPIIMDFLREYYNKPITINNWHLGGEYDGRCLRLPSNPDYTQWSDHSFSNAVDFSIDGFDSLVVQKTIVKDIGLSTQLKQLGVISIEDVTATWIHIGVAPLDGWQIPQVNGIYLIPVPKK